MRRNKVLLGALGLLAALAVWEVVSRSGVFPKHAIPPASSTFSRLAELAGTGEFWTDMVNTLSGWVAGMALATVVAVPLGILLGSFPLAYRAVRVPLEFLRPIPSVALLPLAVLLFGITSDMKIALVFFGALWPILVQSIYGVQEVDPIARDTARSFGFSRYRVFARVVFPSALPNIATGMRTSAAIGLVLAITSELVAGVHGLGRSILLAQSAGDNTTMYALIVVTGVLGWVLFYVFATAESRLLRWHPSNREAVA